MTDNNITVTCPHCGGEFVTADLFDNVETIAPKRIEFDLDKNSAAMVFVEHDGKDVLAMMPGGHLTAFGETITPGQLSAVLSIYLEERLKG